MAYSDEVLADSPLAYYRLGEAAGTTMVDSSGNGRNGTYSGPIALGVTGLLVGDGDTCADFTGGSDPAGAFVGGAAGTVPAAGWMQVTAAITVECIFQTDTVASTHAIVTRADWNAPYNSTYAWTIHRNGDTLQMEVFRGNSATLARLTSPAGSIGVGQVHHAAFTFDGTTVRGYLDGTEFANAPLASPLNTGGTTPLTIGRTANTIRSWDFDGRIDEVALYGTALPAGRIAAHYSASVTPPTPAATLAGTAPGVSGSFAATATVEAFDAALAGTAPSVTGSFSGGIPDAVTGTLAGQAPAVFGDFAGSYAAAPPEPVLTDTTYANDGYNYDGTADVEFEPPIEEPPAHIRRAKVMQVHQSMSPPNLVNGVPR